ncbi:hypothetical protein DFJ74DRAFT_261912 [Hyaloraphidium curvatum]|nr:hypothetical protein DFJ74DRAFT_261912 [Hyaloraphidium curvatum]
MVRGRGESAGELIWFSGIPPAPPSALSPRVPTRALCTILPSGSSSHRFHVPRKPVRRSVAAEWAGQGALRTGVRTALRTPARRPSRPAEPRCGAGCDSGCSEGTLPHPGGSGSPALPRGARRQCPPLHGQQRGIAADAGRHESRLPHRDCGSPTAPHCPRSSGIEIAFARVSWSGVRGGVPCRAPQTAHGPANDEGQYIMRSKSMPRNVKYNDYVQKEEKYRATPPNALPPCPSQHRVRE